MSQKGTFLIRNSPRFWRVNPNTEEAGLGSGVGVRHPNQETAHGDLDQTVPSADAKPAPVNSCFESQIGNMSFTLPCRDVLWLFFSLMMLLPLQSPIHPLPCEHNKHSEKAHKYKCEGPLKSHSAASPGGGILCKNRDTQKLSALPSGFHNKDNPRSSFQGAHVRLPCIRLAIAYALTYPIHKLRPSSLNIRSYKNVS